MAIYKWDLDKNEWLKSERGICFEDITYHIEMGNLLDIIDHPNRVEYKNQKIYMVAIKNYIYMVPYVEDNDTTHLITIIPSRKMTKKYLGSKRKVNGND